MKTSEFMFRESCHAMAARPEGATLAASLDLLAGVDETMNNGQSICPSPSTWMAASVDDPRLLSSTQNTNAPFPLCTFHPKPII